MLSTDLSSLFVSVFEFESEFVSDFINSLANENERKKENGKVGKTFAVSFLRYRFIRCEKNDVEYLDNAKLASFPQKIVVRLDCCHFEISFRKFKHYKVGIP